MLKSVCVLAGSLCMFCWNLLVDYGLKLRVFKQGLYAEKCVCCLEIRMSLGSKIVVGLCTEMVMVAARISIRE